MKTIRSALLAALAIVAILPARAEDKQAVEKDMARLQGEWTMVTGTADGQTMPDATRTSAKRVCKDNETSVTVGGQLMMKAMFTIDPSQKPKTVDYDMVDGWTKGKKQLGIYELEGDTVKFCFGAPDAERPREFTSQPGDRRTLSVWKRAKEAAPQPKQK